MGGHMAVSQDQPTTGLYQYFGVINKSCRSLYFCVSSNSYFSLFKFDKTVPQMNSHCLYEI